MNRSVVTFVPLTGAPPVSVCLAYRPRRGNPLVRQFVSFAGDCPEFS